jgi:hypothetical protein
MNQVAQYKPYREITPNEELERYVVMINNYIDYAKEALKRVKEEEFLVNIPKLSDFYETINNEITSSIKKNNLSFLDIMPISLCVEELNVLIDNIKENYGNNLEKAIAKSIPDCLWFLKNPEAM